MGVGGCAEGAEGGEAGVPDGGGEVVGCRDGEGRAHVPVEVLQGVGGKKGLEDGEKVWRDGGGEFLGHGEAGEVREVREKLGY